MNNQNNKSLRRATGNYTGLLSRLTPLAALILITGCNPSTTTAPVNASSNPPVAAPQPATVEERDITGQIPLNSQIAVPPSARADLTAPFRAPVNKVDKTVGAGVEKGDVLVELSLPTAEAYHEQTKLNLKQAETDYANAQKQYQVAVDAAQKQVDAAKSAQSTQSTTSPDGTTNTDAGAASGDLVTAQQTLQQAKADMATQLIPFKQALEEARTANQQARAGEKQGNIRTPITGTVLALNAQPGKEVGANARAVVATVVDLSAIQVQATMDNSQASHVKPKMDVILTFDELPGKQFEGTVSKITSTPSKQFVALIQFKNRDAQVKPDMHAHAGIKTGEDAKNTPAIPSAAITLDSTGRPTVNVMRNGNWQRVGVEAGITDGQFTQVKSGLTKGETVQVPGK